MKKKKEIFDVDSAMLEAYPCIKEANDLIFDKPEYEIMPDIEGIDLVGMIAGVKEGEMEEVRHCDHTITISRTVNDKVYIIFNWAECYDEHCNWILIDNLTIGNLVLNYNRKKCIYDCLHIFEKDDVCVILESFNDKSYVQIKPAEVEKMIKLKK